MPYGDVGGYAGAPNGYGESPSGYAGTAGVKDHNGGPTRPPPAMGQTLAPVAATDTGYQNAAQPGPAAMPSTQWQAMHAAQVPSPHQPGIAWQVPHAQQMIPVQTYGAPQQQYYAGAPTIVFAWQGSGGWVYKLLNTDVILASGVYNGQQITDKALNPGSDGHKAAVEEWIKLNPQSLPLPIGQKMLALRSAGEPGLFSQMYSAVRDAVSTVSGGTIAPSPQPSSTPSAPSAMVPQVPGFPSPSPAPSSNRGLMVAGGVLVLLGLAAGAWYVYGQQTKKNPAEKSSDGPDKKAEV